MFHVNFEITWALLFIYCFNFHIKLVYTWDSEELELFDLVEDVNQNFYEVLEISEDASSAEIRKAYRRMSLLHHPDKSKEEGANERFRKIVAVSEVLRDETKRKRYNQILRDGLPDWRQPVYYYRRVRRMGLLEMLGFLLILLTTGQYLVAWASYWEKKYELEEVFLSKFKKRSKKKSRTCNQHEEIADHMIQQLPRPCVRDLLPLQLLYFMYYIVTSVPSFLSVLRETLRKKEQPKEVDDDYDDISSYVERKPRKRIKPDLPDRTGEESNRSSSSSESEREEDVPDPICRDKWTNHDTVALVRAVNKFPGGTPDRWNKIAKALGRPLSEVTEKAKELKGQTVTANLPANLQGVTGKMEPWSQEQQKALEEALKVFPKSTPDRWDHIAHSVPDRTKEECMQRYKELVEIVRQRKANA